MRTIKHVVDSNKQIRKAKETTSFSGQKIVVGLLDDFVETPTNEGLSSKF